MRPIFNSLGSNYDRRTRKVARRAPDPRAFTKLEEYLANRYEAKSIELTYKGREAIARILQQLKLPEGSFVAVNGYTCYAVYDAITAARLKPYYIDIPLDGLNFTAAALQEAVKAEPAIKAVMVQNTLGLPCQIEAIAELCKEQKLPLVEDLAHSVGLRYATGDEAGTVGTAAALSFSQDKMIDAVSGGAIVWQRQVEDHPRPARPVNVSIVMRDKRYPNATAFVRRTHRLGVGKLALAALRKAGALPRPMGGQADHSHLPSPWHCQLALDAFDRLGESLAHRAAIAAIYRELLPAEICWPHINGATYLRFPIRVENRRKLLNYLKSFNIHLSDIWYDAPVAPKRMLGDTDYEPGRCPNAEAASEQMVNLPTHINISEAQARQLAGRINAWRLK